MTQRFALARLNYSVIPIIAKYFSLHLVHAKFRILLAQVTYQFISHHVLSGTTLVLLQVSAFVNRPLYRILRQCIPYRDFITRLVIS